MIPHPRIHPDLANDVTYFRRSYGDLLRTLVHICSNDKVRTRVTGCGSRAMDFQLTGPVRALPER
jgi:hypothetical protein